MKYSPVESCAMMVSLSEPISALMASLISLSVAPEGNFKQTVRQWYGRRQEKGVQI